MIVRMSKVEIYGPKHLLLETLADVQELGIFHIEKEAILAAENGETQPPPLDALKLDEESMAARLFYESLLGKIRDILSCLPQVDLREVYLSPLPAIDSIKYLVDRHGRFCRERSSERAELSGKRDELIRYTAFLEVLQPLLVDAEPGAEVDFIALEMLRQEELGSLRELVERTTSGHFDMQTAEAEGDRTIVLITAEKSRLQDLKEALRDHRMPELELPEPLRDLSFIEQLHAAVAMLRRIKARIGTIDRELRNFADRWAALYSSIESWLKNQLTMFKATTQLYETEMCFFLFGWLPSAEVDRLTSRLELDFKGEVVVAEQDILQQDMDRIPVILKNPPYFRPFELLSRLLPLPHYSSYDPTPFLGIFFPIFFGMILGDVGYGLILLAAALLLIAVFGSKRPLLGDVGRILGVASLYTIIFGFLFGEFFGLVGTQVFGLQPILFHRHESVMPMLLFALSVGAVHVIIGLILGFISALRRHHKKEAVFKVASIFFILCLAAGLVSMLAPGKLLLKKPLMIAMLVSTPVLLLSGGFLAPLELFKTIGNIISYARIMAVGLTSVLLAYVANHLAGNAGSAVVGALAAVFLHLFNILLGLFAPTVHSLRLHYVEFFSKFMESGGKHYKPLEKTD